MKPAGGQSKRGRCKKPRVISLAAILGAGLSVVVLCTALGPGTEPALSPTAAVSNNCATGTLEITSPMVTNADRTEPGATVTGAPVADSSTNQMPGVRAETGELGSTASAQPDPTQFYIGTNVIPPSDTLPEGLWFSPTTREFIKLVRAGVDEPVLASYIRHAPGTFNLQAEHIIYLADLGVSAELLDAMLEHDRNFGLTPSGSVRFDQVCRQQESASGETASVADLPNSQEVAVDSNVVRTDEVRPAAGPTTVNHYYFYESLAPYGSWLFVDGLGWCWRPTVVVIHRGWMPYCHGGWWVYTSFGWYWYSRYSWGSIVFHYGRWFYHPVWGWCWWPDTVWAPAWVLWRHNDVYCGWAPLPPHTQIIHGKGLVWRGRPVPPHHHFDLRPDHFTYVRWADIHRRDLERYRPPQHQLETLHRDTTPRVELDSDERGLVIHRGLLDEFEKRFGRPTPKELVLDRVPTRTGHLLRARFADTAGVSDPILPQTGGTDQRAHLDHDTSKTLVPARFIHQEHGVTGTRSSAPQGESGFRLPRAGADTGVHSGNRRRGGNSDRAGLTLESTQNRAATGASRAFESSPGFRSDVATVRDARPDARFGLGPASRPGSAGTRQPLEKFTPRNSAIAGLDRQARESTVQAGAVIRETRREPMSEPVSRSDPTRILTRTRPEPGRDAARAVPSSDGARAMGGGYVHALRDAGGVEPASVGQSKPESAQSAPAIRSEPPPTTRSFQPAVPAMSAPVLHSHGGGAPTVPGGRSGVPARSVPVIRSGKVVKHQ